MSVTDSPRAGQGLAADPRPAIVEHGGHHHVYGGRCDACGHDLAVLPSRCARCGAAVSPHLYGPLGTVWAFTVVHVPGRPGEEVPYTLAYVDLDDGPRVLVRLGSGAAVGSRIELTSATAAGDPAARVLA
jgi:uncharacterized OB-fold protein